ncbi:hypothetical protein SH1V18_21550 [Vallitalea longa]|uniref:DUF5107 domain-containing protein n=1 Tax=Vallitalea longa TaxID=2936439 RepID=A0A9W5YBQ8_9FIRM|nr:DUF5107 domain-containing protein [Vallitalea longa]GKX29675.1 hypothetical protein SH1V18_21550 [Vallitalea longa]
MSIYKDKLYIQGNIPIGENPLPMFRDMVKNRPVVENGTFKEEHKIKFGYETGRRVLPYRMQERYTRDRRLVDIDTIVFENDKLKATFLPAYGGRLYSLENKSTGKELLYKNNIFQPANLAIRDAWFSGGIEWNIAQYGHTFSTCSPMFFAICEDDDGNEFLRMYEYERCKSIFWNIDFHLPEGRDVLSAYVRIVNDNNHTIPMYWWTNIAVEEKRDIRVFSGSNDIIYQDVETMKKINNQHAYGYGQMPHIYSFGDMDVSYPEKFKTSIEYFFQNENDDTPWEAVKYNNGDIFIERSSNRIHYKKMFCWGTHKGGKSWQHLLSANDTDAYLELQSGMANTQEHGIDMPPNTVWDFAEFFSSTNMKVDNMRDDWKLEKEEIYKCVENKINSSDVNEYYEEMKKLAEHAPKKIIYHGSGWGALEIERRKKYNQQDIPKGLIFPKETLSEEQDDWFHLLSYNMMPKIKGSELPASWMVDKKWQYILEKSTDIETNVMSIIHLGNIYYENGERKKAIDMWEKSIKLTPTALAYRNIAYYYIQVKKLDIAFLYMKKAIDILDDDIELSYAKEYLELLIECNKDESAWKFYKSLAKELQDNDRLQILMCDIALNKRELEFLDEVFSKEISSLREGDTKIVDTWYKFKAMMIAEENNVKYDEDLLNEIKSTINPPQTIDFRQFM